MNQLIKKPTILSLLTDIEDCAISIKKIPAYDYLKVYEMYTNICNRLYNLKKEDFNDDIFYNRYLEMTSDIKTITRRIEGLRLGNPTFTYNNFIYIRLQLLQIPGVIKFLVTSGATNR